MPTNPGRGPAILPSNFMKKPSGLGTKPERLAPSVARAFNFPQLGKKSKR